MRSFSKRSLTRLATATLLLGSLTLTGVAQAAGEVSSDGPVSYTHLTLPTSDLV